LNNGKDDLKSGLCKGFHKILITSISIYFAATVGVANTPAGGTFPDSIPKSGRINRVNRVSYQLKFGLISPVGTKAFQWYLMREWGIERFKEDFLNGEFSVLLHFPKGRYIHLTVGSADEHDTRQSSNQNQFTNFEHRNIGVGLGKEVLLSNRFVLFLRASYYESTTIFEIYETNSNIPNSPVINLPGIYASSKAISISHISPKIGAHLDFNYKFDIGRLYFMCIGWYFNYRYVFNNSNNEIWSIKGTNQSVTLPAYAKKGFIGSGISIIFTSK